MSALGNAGERADYLAAWRLRQERHKKTEAEVTLTLDGEETRLSVTGEVIPHPLGDDATINIVSVLNLTLGRQWPQFVLDLTPAELELLKEAVWFEHERLTTPGSVARHEADRLAQQLVTQVALALEQGAERKRIESYLERVRAAVQEAA